MLARLKRWVEFAEELHCGLKSYPEIFDFVGGLMHKAQELAPWCLPAKLRNSYRSYKKTPQVNFTCGVTSIALLISVGCLTHCSEIHLTSKESKVKVKIYSYKSSV